MTYCLVPRDLAGSLHEMLRRHFRDDPRVEVVVERRHAERRSGAERRGEEAPSVAAESAPEERRRVRGSGGRRVGERRAPMIPVAAPPLPRRARRHADRLSFVERVEPSEHLREDHDTARLVTAVQAGDRELFSTIYMRYYDRVYGYLRVALNDEHEARDVAQQVFTEVLAAIPDYERRSQPFRAWLFMVVRNRAVDSLRKRGRLEPTDPAELERRRERAQRTEPTPAAESLLEWISDRDLHILIERLPLAQRQVLMLRFVVGLSSAEIAQLLGRTPKSVRMLQHRAVTALRDRLTAIGRAPRHERRARSHRVLRRSPVAAARRFSLIAPGPTR